MNKIKLDKDGIMWVDHTLQCYFISLGNPDLVLKSEDEEIQHRIDLYNKSKNLALFLSPTKKEFEKEFGKKNRTE